MGEAKRAAITAETLASIELFSDLDHTERSAIAQRCEGAIFDEGSSIVLQRDARTDVFFIVSGTVRVTYHSKPGKDVQFRYQEAGDFFGELSAIDGEPRSADVLAVSNVFVGAIKAQDFIDIATHYPAVSERVMSHLTAIVRSLSERVVELSTLGVANRLHAEILRLARQSGIDNNRADITPTPTHAELASRVSTQREAVTKELRKLARAGILEGKRGSLIVSDVQRLEEMVINVTDTEH